MLYELCTGIPWRGRFGAKKREYVREKYQDIARTHINANLLVGGVVEYLHAISILMTGTVE